MAECKCKDPEDVVAKLVIHNFPTMDDSQKERLALWLRDKSREIMSENPQEYDKKFTARLMK